ncbi:MAG: hypothetical protein MI974_05145 [Chitinophagales bacterium]|nr:hypothetical protein [Chitinophagales bacterium]
MHRILLCCFIGSIILIAGACNLSSLDDPIVVTDLENEFYLDLWEHLEPEGRFLEWRLRTIENAECEDASIDYFYRNSGGTIGLNINAIINPADCTPSEQPLSVYFAGGQLNNDVYPISIGVRDAVVNEGSLIVSDDSYRLSFSSLTGVVLLKRVLRRIPDPVIWGYIHTQHDSLQVAADEFMNNLETKTLPVSLKEGNYGYFSVDNEAVIIKHIHVPEGATMFAYEYIQDDDVLEGMITSLKEEHPNGIEVRIFNTKGGEFY